ncbi:MAG: TraB/GumN family protein [Syntrophomonadaceae bacterium]|jgi:pheromone shutdown-related protein TraB|nr:TraB/GumN family protein [Syntrophomonadaceae bacterium]
METVTEQQNVTRLEYEGKEIILIATAHVSKESVELVKEVISTERPDSVCIELDQERFDNMQDPEAWQKTDLVKVIKAKKVGFMIANLFLGSYQKKIARQLGVAVGGEMKQGIESAQEIGAQLVLADRSIQTTFLRIWRKLGFGEKVKLLFSLIWSIDEEVDITEDDLQEMLQQDMLESVIADVRKQFPQIGEVLIGERDQYLANRIKNAPGPKIAAVLGGAHVPGVKEEIFKTQNIEEISSVPPAGPWAKVAGWFIPAAILLLIGYAFLVDVQTGWQQLSTWVLWTGSLAALFTALSFGHPLSILTSFVAAPFTTLNPVLACGWISGLVEAAIRKPAVEDLQNVGEDILSIKGFYRNRLLRTLLVIVMTNLGASIGTFVAGADIIKHLI